MTDDIWEMFRNDFARLEDHPGVDMHLSAYQAWCVLGQLQLAHRHPENTGPSAQIAAGIARELESAVATTPALARVAQQGWEANGDGDWGTVTGEV